MENSSDNDIFFNEDYLSIDPSSIKSVKPVVNGYTRVTFESDYLTEDELIILNRTSVGEKITSKSIEITYYMTREYFELMCEKAISQDFYEGLIIKFAFYAPTSQLIKEFIYTDIDKADFTMSSKSGNHDILLINLIYQTK